MATDVELAIRMTADATDASNALESVGESATRMAADVDQAADKASAAGDRMGSISDSADNLGSSSSQAAGGIGDLGGALSAMPGPLGAVGTGMESMAPLVMGVTGATDLATLAMNSNIVTTVRSKAATAAHAVTTRAAAVATKVAAAGQWLLNAAMAANPIGLVVIAIALLVGGLILAYQKSETFRTIVDKAFSLAKKAIDPVVTVVGSVVTKVGDAISKVGDIAPAFDTMKGLVVGYVNAVLEPITFVYNKLKDFLDLLASAPDNPFNRVAARGGSGDAKGDLYGQTSGTDGRGLAGLTLITINFNGLVTDPRAAAREVEKMLRRNRVATGGAV